MTEAILKRASSRTPRYTSYPTAAQFVPSVGPAQASRWLSELPPEEPISLYLHVPFCAQICWYCACNMKLGRRPEPLEAYAEDLEAELALVAGVASAKRVARVHWGGGTPTSLPMPALARLMASVGRHFDLTSDVETAFELDPRNVPPGLAEGLAELGARRASLGVQEFDPKVQAAINRIQPFDVVKRVVGDLRAADITAINFDLIYGLPYQTTQTISRTIAQTVELAPSRIALFGYAHVPWMSKRQRMLPEHALPGSSERFDQAETAAELLMRAGYVRVGLDHFARPDDGLAIAAKRGELRRNFQGYTDDPVDTVVGVGATAISATPQGYYQNVVETGAWARSVRDGLLPTARGAALTPEDRLRRDVINALMCDLQVDVEQIARAHGRADDALDPELARCAEFADDGLARINGRRLQVTEHGRPALRMIAAAFDAYISAAETAGPRHAVAV